MDCLKCGKNRVGLGLFLLLGLLVTAFPAQAETVDVTQLRRIHAIAPNQSKPGHVFLATRQGLFLASPDGKAQWVTDTGNMPVSMVHTGDDGSVFVYSLLKGLMKGNPEGTAWQTLNNQFGSQIPIDMASEPGPEGKLFLTTQAQWILVSTDSGKSWKKFGQKEKPLSASGKRGEKLFTANCQSCHGVGAVGESFSLQALSDKDYQMAPALNGSAHAWHHVDADLIKTILEGSPTKGSRMVGFKDKLSKQDAEDVLAYFQNFWGKREFDCQGPKHMQCM